MQHIDNGATKAIDFLSSSIKSDKAVSIVSRTFSIYALEKFLASMPCIQKMQILLSEAFSGRTAGELVGDEFEKRFRNLLTQQAVAQRSKSWLEANAAIRQIKGNDIVRQNVFVSATTALQGSMDFTGAGLGLVASNRFDLGIGYNAPNDSIHDILDWFASIWNSKDNVEDIKEAVIRQLSWLGADKTPDFIYYAILYHLFSNCIDELDEGQIIKPGTGIQNHLIWKKLYKFQKDGVLGAIDKLEKYNGCIIADSVGLGKTFEALAIIKYYELRNCRVLVLCPKRLRENWTLYRQNDRRNIFCDERFGYDVLNHSDLSRTSGNSGDIDLKTVNWGNYDLVVIDESHNFRNNPSDQKNGMSRYRRLMESVIKDGVKTKVLMLSATPVNNKLNDLKNQIAFITEGNDQALQEKGVASIENTLKQAQTCFNRWVRQPDRQASGLVAEMNFGYFLLLDLLTIARSRKHIAKYYSLDEVGKFPERLTPINIYEDIDTEDKFPPLKAINDTIRRLHLSAYSPLKYVLPSKREQYAKKYDNVFGQGKKFTQLDREESLISLMRVNLLKRMESSIKSFGETTEKLFNTVDSLIGRIDQWEQRPQDGEDTFEDQEWNINDIEIDSEELSDMLVGNKVKVLLQDCDLVLWRQNLQEDKEKLEKLLAASAEVDSARDKKLDRLKSIISEKVKHPINEGNRKILVFTAFADTAEYLYNNVADWAKAELGIESAVVSGSGRNRTTMAGIGTDLHPILTNFSPVSKERASYAPEMTTEIDLLFATDCISEGQNLQDCDYLVNYDIHWNPVRIIQRFGRIDRIGSKNNAIQLVNFWPNMALDEYINLEKRVSGRMVLLDISASGEENVIELPQGGMNDLEYRKRQLKELQSAVIDLEDLSDGISITDLTMNDFRMSLTEFMKDGLCQLKSTPFGARATVAAEGDCVPGAIFCLKDMKGKKPTAADYSLAPFYLVYVADDGSIELNFNEPRKILDVLRGRCVGKKDVQTTAVQAFNKRTKDGSDMAYYRKLLEQAVSAVVGKQQEQGVQTLFQPGGIQLAGDMDRRMEDFEVAAFVVVTK